LSLRELLTRANVANVTAASILLAAVVYSILAKDVEILKYLASFAAGYLFSQIRRRGDDTRASN